MAKRYYGDFRSIDASVDPKGQRYRVVIFTGYNGANPYEYFDITRPIGEMTFFVGSIPTNNYSITMAEQPFSVSYEGDTENIYKPYRCSTATVNFRQSNLNLDFLNSNGNSTLVVLLKWKNSVSLVNGYYYDSETGATLHKLRVVENEGMVGEEIVWYNGFEPKKEDLFCYNVEWVGFSTPETFSMDYSHVTDTFTLNAQDAFSTLQYSKYSWIGDTTVASFADVLLQFCKELGVYKNIYITDTIKFPNGTDSIFHRIFAQQKNNFDDDDKPIDKLEAITQILTYLNLTAIPYKNSLFITTPNAISEGWNYYFSYALPTNGYIFNWPADNANYETQPQVYITDTFQITETSYADGGTSVSTSNVYNSVTADVDEYDVELMLPDITDNNIFTNHHYQFNNGSFLLDGSTSIDWCWEHDFWHAKTENLQTYQYNGTSMDNNAWYTTEVDGVPNYNLSLMEWKPTSAIVDDGGVKLESYSSVNAKAYNPTRKIYFYNPNYTSGWGVVGRSEVDSRWQTMLYTKTTPIVLSGNQYLQITGSWMFYVSNIAIFHTMPTTAYINEYSNYDVDFNASWAYVKAKVKCCGKWLVNTTDGYSWQNAETEVRLYFQNRSGKAHGVQTDFKRTYRNFEGIVVQTPIQGDSAIIGPVEIWISRPLGCGNITSSCATLTDFAVNIIPSNVLNATGTKIEPITNTEYRTEIDPNNIEEYKVEKLTLSSDKDKGARYSQTIRSGYKVMANVYNVSTGNYSLPENHITNNIANQYSTPTVNLQMTLHNAVKPYSLVTWSKMESKKFFVDSVEIDYELERQTITLTEVKTPNTLQTTREDATRNYRRNNDLLTHDNRLTERRRTVLAIDPVVTYGTFNTLTGIAYFTGDAETIGNISIQPNFSNATMQVSIPNSLTDDITFSNVNGELTITTP